MQRRALGKGLGALIPEAEINTGAYVKEITIERIIPGDHQPRKSFNEKSIAELAASIKDKGVLQPIIVRRHNEDYQIIVGERRWRAAKLAGLRSIPSIIRDASDAETMEIALIENIQRQDLNPLEEAEAYKRLIEEYKLTQEELATRIGKDRSSIANYLRLLKLPKEIKEDLISGNLSMGHARALLALDSSTNQIRLRNEIVKRKMSVRLAEKAVRKYKSKKKIGVESTPEIESIREAMMIALGTKVRVVGTLKGGRVEIDYYSAEDLERIYDHIVKKPPRRAI